MSNFFGSALAGGWTNYVYDGPTFEGYNVEAGGEFAIAMESAQDQLEIVAAIADLDVQTTNFVKESMDAGEDGLEYVSESYGPVLEASGSNVFEKIKAAIKKLWGKVKAFFASVVRSLDAMTKSAQDFVKKYKKQIENLKLAGFKYEMHTYTVEDFEVDYKADAQKDAAAVVKTITANINQGAKSESELESVQKQIETFKEGVEDRLDEFRAAILKTSGKLDAQDFREAVRKKLRNGKEDNEKEEVNINIQSIISQIEGTNKLNTKISKVQKEADKIFGDSIKLVDDLEKAINKARPTERGGINVEHNSGAKISMTSAVAPKAAVVASTISRELSAKQAIVNTAISEWSSAVKERDSVYKQVIMKAFSHKADN